MSDLLKSFKYFFQDYGTFTVMLGIALILLLISTIILSKDKETKGVTHIIVDILGIVLSIITFICFLLIDEAWILLLLIPISTILFISILIINHKTEKTLKAHIIIRSIALALIIFSTSMIFLLAITDTSIGVSPPKDYYVQNAKFETYFGTDVKGTEVKELLLEIRTNNLTGHLNKEASIIGVCFIPKNENNIDRTDKNTFNNYKFNPNVSEIEKYINEEGYYTVGDVPNGKLFNIENNSLGTGFEPYDSVSKQFGNTQTGDTGGYYSSGYIRLIYIIENSN